MTRHMHNPFRREDGAQVYDLSAELFFCLLQLYRDFSNKRAGFELTAYYELYLQVSENKRVLNALFTPKSNLSAYLESYDFAYDIANQKQVIDVHDEIWGLSISEYTWSDDALLHDLIVSATMLKNLYLSYQTFLHQNKTGLALRWQGYTLAFLGEEPLMAMAIYPGHDQGDWFAGDVAGLEGYVISDLKRDNILESNVRIWGGLHAVYTDEAAARKRENKRLNKKLRKQSRQ